MIFRKSCFLFNVIIVFLIFCLPAAAAEEFVLLKAPAKLPAAVGSSAGIIVVQELQTCSLVCAPRRSLNDLQKAGVAFEIADSLEANKSYFLLHSRHPQPLLPGARGLGCLQLEAGIWLLQTRDPGFRAWLAEPFSLKALRLPRTFSGSEEAGTVSPRADRAKTRARLRPEAEIADLVAQVSREQLQADIRALQDFGTRYASTPQCEAAGDFLLKRFQQIGLAVVSDPFAFESAYHGKNIVAVIPGMVAPEQIVLACAHYDSTSNNRYVSAPGADDNASGTAAILELARILGAAKFDFSIVLLCVSAEEWGLYGSAHYARQASQEGAEIVGVVNLDMIAFPGASQRVLDVIGNHSSEWLADRFIAVAQPYVGLRLDKVIDPSMVWSDHSSFWDQGYPALCGIEDSDNPYYHRTSDTLDKLDLGFAADATRAALAVVADLAQPFGTLKAPTGLQARSQVSMSLFTSRKTVYLQWDAGDDSQVGFHVYRAGAAHGTYERLTGQPLAANMFVDPLLLPDRTYYYVVTAVDESGRESNYSKEVRDDENN